jgi:hypothetical protein
MGLPTRRRDQRVVSHSMRPLYHLAFPRPTSEAERLIKQTYSVTVSLPADRDRRILRKWHLSKPRSSLRSQMLSSRAHIISAAYYSQQELESLRSIDEIDGVGNVTVPEGWFKSARGIRTRREPREQRENASTTNRADAESELDSDSTGHLSMPIGPTPHTHTHRHSTIRSQGNYGFEQHSQDPVALHYRAENMNTPPTSPHQERPRSPRNQLVPLEYLRTVTMPRRSPADEQLLSRFSTEPLLGQRNYNPSYTPPSIGLGPENAERYHNRRPQVRN